MVVQFQINRKLQVQSLLQCVLLYCTPCIAVIFAHVINRSPKNPIYHPKFFPKAYFGGDRLEYKRLSSPGNLKRKTARWLF